MFNIDNIPFRIIRIIFAHRLEVYLDFQNVLCEKREKRHFLPQCIGMGRFSLLND